MKDLISLRIPDAKNSIPENFIRTQILSIVDHLYQGGYQRLAKALEESIIKDSINSTKKNIEKLITIYPDALRSEDLNDYEFAALCETFPNLIQSPSRNINFYFGFEKEEEKEAA